MAADPEFAENFRNMRFLNDPMLKRNGQALEIQVARMNVSGIAIFLAMLTICLSATAAFMVGFTEMALVATCGMMATFLFAGMFYLINMEIRNDRLPYIDTESECVVLASGTRIHRPQINSFRLRSAKAQNFRLVLISVITKTENGTAQYALSPVTGRLKDVTIANELADYFDVKLDVIDQSIKDHETLKAIGIAA